MENQHVSSCKNSLIDVSPALVFITELESKNIQWCNKTMEDFLGYPLSEIQKMKHRFFQKLIHPKDLINARSFFMKGEHKPTCICRFRRKQEKKWYWFYGNANVYDRYKNGGVKTLFCSFLRFEIPNPVFEEHKRLIHIIHEPVANPKAVEGLSSRQKKLLPYIAAGLYDQEIAEIFNNSVKTIETHIKHIRAKLDVHSRLKLAILLRKMGY